MSLPVDYFANGIAAFASAVRSRQHSFEDATRATLDRIALLDPALQAFEYVDANNAIDIAKGLDTLLAAGNDLGPLMGVTVGVKDIIAVDGLPATLGSNHSADHLILTEGSVIKKLRAAGCVIVGKTKTVEFALGATGINTSRGTPRNPCDATQHRIPGGSSSGSAVAVAAGCCGFALGSDTGGSVRIPACYNGITGLKTTVGQWPTDGVFPLSGTFDSIGVLTNRVADAALVHNAIVNGQPAPPATLSGLRLGIPNQFFFDQLDPPVADAFDQAIKALQNQGVGVTPFDLPESFERDTLMPLIMGSEIIAALTPEGFQQARNTMDPVTSTRAAVGLDVKAHEYVQAQKRVQQLKKIAADKFTGFDAWVSPTCPMLPLTVDEINQSEALAQRSLLSSRNTQPPNLFGLCATSLPLTPNPHPIGLQVMMPANQDNQLLSVSAAIQQSLGIPDSPDLTRFIT